VPLNILILDFFIFFFFSAGIRVSKRFYYEIIKSKKPPDSKKTLIIGAGNLGELLVRNLIKNNFKPYYPIGFLDDNKDTKGLYIQNVKVLGQTNDLEKVIKNYKIETVIIAISSLSIDKLREIYKNAISCGIKEVKTIPKYFFEKIDFEKPFIEIKELEDIKIEDIIGRQEIKIDKKKVKDFLEDKIVLITGSAGSIGGEISEQLCEFNPKLILLYEIDETELFFQENKLKEKYSQYEDKIIPIVGDIKDFNRTKFVFEKFRPEIVFHSAAYKHVPIMEKNPSEAIKTNILGTYNLCKLASEFKTEKFILISTDKAVNPTSIMGATKRFCEYLIMSFNKENGCKFIAVRFGNVLGSRGSVLPIFLEQIKNKKPIVITHPEMKRYFMTTEEAVSLVLESSAIGKGGEVFVLDMGKPVNILNLAEELIRLHGLEPYKEIEIRFSQPRPGEKFFEEILTSEEGTKSTKYDKIYTANISTIYSKEFLEEKIKELKIYADNSDKEKIIEILKQVVTSYKPYERNTL